MSVEGRALAVDGDLDDADEVGAVVTKSSRRPGLRAVRAAIFLRRRRLVDSSEDRFFVVDRDREPEQKDASLLSICCELCGPALTDVGPLFMWPPPIQAPPPQLSGVDRAGD